jgi:hypothetical protein
VSAAGNRTPVSRCATVEAMLLLVAVLGLLRSVLPGEPTQKWKRIRGRSYCFRSGTPRWTGEFPPEPKVCEHFHLAHFFLQFRHSALKGRIPQLATSSGPIGEQGLDAETEGRGEHRGVSTPRSDLRGDQARRLRSRPEHYMGIVYPRAVPGGVADTDPDASVNSGRLARWSSLEAVPDFAVSARVYGPKPDDHR